MMSRILSAVGGTLEHVPRAAVRLGAPTSAAVTLQRADGAALPSPVAAAAATVDPVDAEVTVDVDAGARELEVDATTGIVPGRRYLLTLGDGQRLVVRAAAVDADTVYLFAGVPVAVDVGASLAGLTLSVAVSAENAVALGRKTDPGLCRALWSVTYPVGGAVLEDELYRVVPRLLSSPAQLDELDVYLPAEQSRLTRPDQAPQLAAYFDAAWLELLDDCEAKGYRPDRIMDPERLRVPHLLRTAALVVAGQGPKLRDLAKEMAADATAKLDAALNAGSWYDADDDATDDEGEQRFTTIELVR